MKEFTLSPVLGSTAALHLVEGQYLFQYRDAQQGERLKRVSSAAVRLAFCQEPADTGWLTPDVVRVAEYPAGPLVASYRPPGRAQLAVEWQSASEIWTLPLPGLLLCGQNTSYHIWALDAACQPSARLYHAPLPNIGDEGLICFGGNTAPVASIATVGEVWRLFYESPFNGHSVAGRCHSQPQDVRRLLCRLHRGRRRQFPVNELVPSQQWRFTTVTQAWQSLSK